MAEYRRQDMPEDMIVRISPGRNTITVQECIANGVVRYREIDPVEFYFALNGSCISNVYQRSGFLPEHCLHISMNAAERRYVIWNPELRADVIYRGREYQNFPLPRLVFGLRVIGNGKVADRSRSPRIRRPRLPGKHPACFQALGGLSRDERTAAARYMRLRFSWPCTPRVFLVL